MVCSDLDATSSPKDDNDKTSLLYQFLLMIDNNTADPMHFGMAFFGASHYQESASAVNDHIVELFAREVGYRLDEILEDIAGQDEVSSEALVAFHHHDHSVTIHGDIQGSNVAIGQSTVSGSNAEYKNNDDVASALKCSSHCSKTSSNPSGTQSNPPWTY